MKASLLLEYTGTIHLNMNEMMFRNALFEIDFLEAEERRLQLKIDYYEKIFEQIRKIARCDRFSYGPFITIDRIYENDNEDLFDALMEVLQLTKPDEDEGKKEDEKNE